MGAGLPLGREEFNDLMGRVDDALKEIEEQAERVWREVTEAGEWLGPLWHHVRALLDQFITLLRRFLSEVGKFLTRWGVPWTLYDHGRDWTHDVGKRASDLVAVADAAQLRVDDYWSGPAATAYLGTIPQQSRALAAVKAATDTLDTVLTRVAGGIIAFWVAMLSALVTFLFEMYGNATAAGTVVGAPAAAAGSGVSTAKVIALVGVIAAATAGYLTLLRSQYTDLAQRLDNDDPFPGGSWPMTTADLSDARVHRDGSLDWHVKTS